MTPRSPLAEGLRLLVATAFGIAALGASSARAQEYGTIKGRLVWGGAAMPDPTLKVKAGDPNVKDPAVCAAADIPNEDYVVDPSTKGVANAYAYILTPQGSNPAAEKALIEAHPDVVIDQKNCRFIPHSAAIHKAQTLVFKSSDAVGHNIRYTGFTVGAFNSMLGANTKQDVKFTAADRNLVPVVCDIHPWMSGNFMVFDHPFFAVTKPDGSFEIKGVPVGKQKLIVRQEKKGYVTPGARNGKEVDVKAGDNDVGEFVLKP